MGTPSNPGWATGYAPTAAEWEAAFSGKADYPVPVGQGGTGLKATPGAGTILIGTGSGFTLATLTAGQGITIDSESGTITITSLAGTPANAFNSYGLQWAVWFNATPLANELLALYTSPINYQYLPNFSGAVATPPLINPASNYVLSVQRLPFNGGEWSEIGTIAISSSGDSTFATTSAEPTSINEGDALRILAPSVADLYIAEFAATLKGYIAS